MPATPYLDKNFTCKNQRVVAQSTTKTTQKNRISLYKDLSEKEKQTKKLSLIDP